MTVFDPFGDLPEPTEVTDAEGRYPARTYASRSFPMQFGRIACNQRGMSIGYSMRS